VEGEDQFSQESGPYGDEVGDAVFEEDEFEFDEEEPIEETGEDNYDQVMREVAQEGVFENEEQPGQVEGFGSEYYDQQSFDSYGAQEVYGEEGEAELLEDGDLLEDDAKSHATRYFNYIGDDASVMSLANLNQPLNEASSNSMGQGSQGLQDDFRLTEGY
jgi:hypothetical protein